MKTARHPAKSFAQHVGFTLIELLVVVSIIALLISILLPSLSAARERARETVCAADTRALTQACLIYSSEYRGVLPDPSLKLGTNIVSPPKTGVPAASQVYYIFDNWRDYLEETYGLQAKHWYSVSNPTWNIEGLYDWPGDQTVIGRFYLTSYKANGKDPATSYMFNGLEEPLPDSEWPLFARMVTDKPYWNLMWTDLNRQWPYTPGYIDWGHPTEPRIGANHLSGDTHDPPDGSHESYLDGSVEYVTGQALKPRSHPGNSVDLWW